MDMIYDASTALLVGLLPGMVSILAYSVCSIYGIHFALLFYAKYNISTGRSLGMSSLPIASVGEQFKSRSGCVNPRSGCAFMRRINCAGHPPWCLLQVSCPGPFAGWWLLYNLQPSSSVTPLDRFVPFFVQLTPSSWTWNEGHMSTFPYCSLFKGSCRALFSNNLFTKSARKC